jgi:hypothetical protein
MRMVLLSVSTSRVLKKESLPSCLFFLDDHSSDHLDVQYWKYAVTDCSHNTVLKVWSCETSTCLQTISFIRGGGGHGGRLKADTDPTARYLVLADIDKCLVFVLSVEQGCKGSHMVDIKRSGWQGVIKKTVSELKVISVFGG